MKYIVGKRLHKDTIQGPTNLKYGSECESLGDIIYYGDKPICAIRSQDAYDYMARNDDGRGLERFNLTSGIMALLHKPDEPNLVTPSELKKVMKLMNIYDKRWMRIWGDGRVHQFKRPEHQDFWIWNFDFYNAEIEDLQYIYDLIAVVK